MKYLKYYLISLNIIIIDQVSKLLVANYMTMGAQGEVPVFGEWFRLHYLLNPGMAFGMEIDWIYGKMILTLLRLAATTAMGIWLYRLIKSDSRRLTAMAVAVILGGAVGNLVDSIFYGAFLDNAPYDAPTPWFHGQVIDMLYFPIYDGVFPSWLGAWGGESFQFFRPVFNIADSSIFIGVVMILIFNKPIQAEIENTEEQDETGENTEVLPGSEGESSDSEEEPKMAENEDVIVKDSDDNQ